jgi:cold shock protein
MEQGTVKRFNAGLGFGFIQRDSGTGDAFVHYSDIQGTGFRKLEVGERCEFEIIATPKGAKAVNVSVLESEG